MTYEEKVLALVQEGGYTRSEAEAMLIDMGEDDDDRYSTTWYRNRDDEDWISAGTDRYPDVVFSIQDAEYLA